VLELEELASVLLDEQAVKAKPENNSSAINFFIFFLSNIVVFLYCTLILRYFQIWTGFSIF